MATKKTKTLAAVTTVTDVTASQYIPLTDGSGNTTKVSLANLKASLLAGIDLNGINDGVFIMFHRNSDRLTALDDWTGKASTAAQITHTECSSASYAPGFCAQYSRVNANGKGLTAGRF